MIVYINLYLASRNIVFSVNIIVDLSIIFFRFILTNIFLNQIIDFFFTKSLNIIVT